MDTNMFKEWSIVIHKHGINRIKHKFKESTRRIRLELKGIQASTSVNLPGNNFDFDIELDEHDEILLTVFQPKKKEKKSPFKRNSFIDDNDEDSSIGLDEEILDEWIPKYVVRAQDMEIIHQKNKKMTLTFFSKKESKDEDQDFIFETEEEANSFAESFHNAKTAIQKRVKRYIKDHNLSRENKNYELKIISASNLRAANTMRGASDPYCIVRIGEKEIHKTHVIQNTIEPVWSDSGMFSASPQDLFAHGLTFEVLDWEKVLKDKPLGWVNVSAQSMLDSNNEQMELTLNQDKFKNKKQGTLIITCCEIKEHCRSNSITPQSSSKAIDSPNAKDEHESENEFQCDKMFASWNVVDEAQGLQQVTNRFYDNRRKLHLSIESNIFDGKNDFLSMLENGQVSRISDDDVIWFQVCRPRKQRLSIRDSLKHASLNSSNQLDESNKSNTAYDSDLWMSTSRFRLQDIKIQSQHRSIVNIKYIGKPDEEFVFESIDDAKNFTHLIDLCKQSIQKERKLFVKKSGRMENEKMWYLVEIISATNLKEVNKALARSDPYCVVRIGDKEIHRTREIRNTLQPIWTSATKSLKLFTASASEILCNGLRFELYDWQKVGKDKPLGQAYMSGKKIMDFMNEEKILHLNKEKGDCNAQGTLKVRIREASCKDIDFMKKGHSYFHESIYQERGLQNPLDFFAPSKVKKSFILSSTTLKNKKTGTNGETLLRVSPYADPDRKEVTSWMTSDAIEDASKQPSKRWIEAGSGNLGHLFVEVIGCDKLYESTLSKFDKIDPFVTLAYEDAVVSTEVVKNRGSPRFMPWTRRAFMFNIDHSRSQLFIGVFDLEKTSVVPDSPIGRLTVDLGNFYPKKEYTLRYNISQSARVYPRKFTGTITLRLSVEYDEKKAFWTSIVPFPQYSINTEINNDNNIVKYAIQGNVPDDKFSQKMLFSYLDEYASFLNAILDVPIAIIPIVLWRTSHIYKFGDSFSLSVPLNSIIMFIQAHVIVERPSLIPTMILGNIGFIMYNSLERQRTKRKSHCYRPRSYFHLVKVATIGTSDTDAIPDIDSNDGLNKDVDETAFDDVTQMPEVKRLLSRLSIALENIWTLFAFGSEAPMVNGIGNPLTYVLRSLQFLLAVIIGPVRALLKIYRWQAYSMACLVTTFCFVSSFLLLILPWKYIFQWMARIFVWIFFGPLMRKLDTYFIRREEKLPKFMEEKIKGFFDNMQKGREQHEKSLSFKKDLFGKYVFHTPGFFTPDRYIDEPLSSSTARTFPEGKVMSKDINKEVRLYGSNLKVDMIPFLPDEISSKEYATDLEVDKPKEE